jgi:hypothetical protein
MLGLCYILFPSSSVECMRGRAVGLEGGCRGNAPEFFFLPRETCHIFRWFFGTWFLPMVFYFQVIVIGLGFWMSLDPICILYCKQCITHE